MATATIDFSLDLGVTNSRIAVARNGAAQVVLTGEGLESTPTAVWCDERERLIVGSQIRDRLVDDAANVAERFMAQLGTGEVFRFARQNRPAEPEDLAAEVIGSLRADARRRTGRDVSAAVLTAPAGFAAAQRDALIAAARKAGVAVSPLLQEPVAAALAYGGPAADAQWLIYDFGGAAFEAALVVLHDGVVQVASHAGDSRLGGELVDWAIVDKLLIPAVAAQFAVTSFRRDNPKWRIAVAKLKMAAEEARIRLDHESSAQIMVPFLCRDDSGAPVRFRHTLTRSELETLLEPVVRRSLKVCERLLVKRDLGFDDLERVVVSGGATRDPYFSRLLTEEGGGLGRRVASSVDPFTVVVQGAALYAGGEPVERAAPPVFVGGQEVAPEPEAEVVEETPVAEPEVTEEEIEEPVEVEEVAAEVPAFAEEEAEEPAEEEAVEPAAEAEEAPVAEEAPEEAAAPEAPEVAEPLMAEPVWPSTADIAEPAAAEEEVAQPVAAEEEVEEPVAAEEEVAEPVAAEEEVEEPAEEEAVEPAAEAEEVPVAEEATEEAAAPEAPEVAEPLMAEPVWPSAADIAEPAEVPPDALGTWIGIPWQRETEERVPTGALPIPDEHAAAEEWRRVSQEAEAAEAAARAEEAAPELEGVPESALEVEKTAPVEAEEEAEEPAEPAALEPAAEEATEEAAAPEAPEVAEPLIVEPVWPSAAEEVPAEEPVAAEEKVEEPAEPAALEPAAEEAPEEAAAPEAPEVAEPLMAEPVWPSAAEEEVEEPAEEEAVEPAAEAEQAVTPEGAGDLWDLVPEEAAVKGVEEQGEAEPLEWTPAEPGPLPPAKPVEPLEKAPPSEPLPPRTGPPAGTLEGTIVARASALVKAGRYGEAKRLVDRLGPTETLSVSALDLLVTIYTHEGQFDAAERLWRRAAGLDPAGHKGESAPRRGAQGKTPGTARRTNGKRWRVPPSVLAGSVAGVALIVIIVIVVLMLHSCGSDTSGVVVSKSPTSVASRTASTSASATPSRSASPTASPVPTGPPVLSLDVPGTHVSTQGDALEVTFDHGLFASGGTELSPDATDSLLRLAQQLRPQADELWVRVTGHTDDVPIARPLTYPDNVSLGMARAVAVVEFFRSQGGLPYVILSARSVDAIHPLGSNRTAAGRARNRTVVIAITRRTQ